METKEEKYDFSGWATVNDIKCSDGRIIRKDAFKHNDGQQVPLVWNHNHSDVHNVLGHAILFNRPEGVYAYGKFNNTEQGLNAKQMVQDGDIKSLSIYANQLKQNGFDVMHGNIRELSLVLAGANPGAKIENVMMHSDSDQAESAIIYNPSEDLELDVTLEPISHAEENKKEEGTQSMENSNSEKTVKEVYDSLTEEQKSAVQMIVGQAVIDVKKQYGIEDDDAEAQHSDEDEDGDALEHAEGSDKTIKEILDSLTDEQRDAVDFIVGYAVQEERKKLNENNVEDKEMKQNAFDATQNEVEGNTLAHADIIETINKARKTGSLRDAMNELCLAHSITSIDVLFPEAKALANQPTVINDDVAWVADVMSGVKKSPFSKVKMMSFDITGPQARAKGYVKGRQKVEEVIRAIKRTTDAQTVYKVQKLDRDDIIDITDLDVVAFIKNEMRGKLNEEIALAILTGDGRSPLDNDKIFPDKIRPILGDDSTYVVAKYLQQGEMNESQFAKYFIKQCIKSRKEYKGSGNPTLFCTEDLLTEMLLIEDKNERVIYDTMDKLKTALRVSKIVTVPAFDNISRTSEGYTYTPMAILVNLNDYTVGANKGGEVNMFDDFDIDFNKYEYLIETRISGAMTQPYGAITFEKKVAVESPETTDTTEGGDDTTEGGDDATEGNN